MDRLSIFDTVDDTGGIGSTMVFGAGEIKKQLDPSFQSVEDMSVVLPPGMDLMKVYLRIRPFTKSECRFGENQKCMQVKDDTTVLAYAPKESNNYRTSLHGLTRSVHKFNFSHIFREDTTQAQLFKATTFPVVKEFVEGHNCLVFTYGVTNSGKTFTVLGTETNPGIVPRALDVIFNSVKNQLRRDASIKPRYYCDATQLSARELIEEMKIKQAVMKAAAEEELELPAGEVTNVDSTISEDSLYTTVSSDKSEELGYEQLLVDVKSQGDVKFSMWVSFLEVYNESAYDLLEHVSKKTNARIPLPLKEDRNGMPYVKGLKEIHVTSAEEAIKLLKIGQRNLQVASTRLNHNSSRSHCIFTIKMLRIVNTDNPHIARMSMLSFCDLAGSERQSKTQSIGIRMKEASNINTSLLQLGLCIKTLRQNQRNKERQQVVPYRDSKLTRLFQSFFSGHGTVTMIINVSGCATTFDETLHALKYGALATQIMVGQELEPVKPPPSFPKVTELSSKDLRRTMQWASPRTLSLLKAEEDQARNVPLPEVDNDDGNEDVNEDPLEHENERLRDENKKMWDLINVLKSKCAEEMKKNIELEQKIREEVCTEMQKQLIDLENAYKVRIANEQALMEERHEDRLDIVVASIKRTKKRKRLFMNGDEVEEEECGQGDYSVSIEKQLDEERLLRKELEDKFCELEVRAGRMERELDALQAERNSLAAQKTSQDEKITRLEFELSSKQLKYDNLTEEIQDMKSYLKDLDSAEANLKEKYSRSTADLEMSLRQVENSLLQSNLRADKLAIENETLQQTIKDLEVIVEDLKTALEEMKMEKLSDDSDRQQLSILEQNNNDLSAKLAAVLESQKLLEGEKVVLLEKVDRLEFELAAGRCDNQDLRNELSESRAKCEETEAARAKISMALQQSQVEHNDIASNLRKCIEDLKHRIQEEHALQQSNTEHEDIINDLRKCIEDLKLQLNEERTRAEKAQTQQETSHRQLLEANDTQSAEKLAALEKIIESQAEELNNVRRKEETREQEKCSLEAALQIAEKTVEDKENELEEMQDQLKELEDQLEATTSSLCAMTEECQKLRKACDEQTEACLKWQQLATTQVKDVTSASTNDAEGSSSVIESAKGRRRQTRKTVPSITASENEVDVLVASPIAPPSRPRRNRRPKIACTQVDMSMDDDDAFECDSKQSTKENIDLMSNLLDNDSNVDFDEPQFTSPKRSPLPKGRHKRALLRTNFDEQFCASPAILTDDLKERAKSASHDSVLKSLRTRNRKQ